jgi:hypothetical protein
MRGNENNPSTRRTRASDPLARAAKRDRRQSLDRSYRRELAREASAERNAAFWDRRFA